MLEPRVCGEAQQAGCDTQAPDRMDPDSRVAVQSWQHPAEGREQAVTVIQGDRRPYNLEREVDHRHAFDSGKTGVLRPSAALTANRR